MKIIRPIASSLSASGAGLTACGSPTATEIALATEYGVALMQLPFARLREVAICGVLLATSFVAATPVSAAVPACPLASDALVAQAVGSAVHGGIMTDFISDNPLDTGPDKTVCWWDTEANTSVTLSRQTNAFGPDGAATPAELAQSLFRVPDEARSEVDALHQAGVSDVQLPNYSLAAASGVGDAAVWVFQKDPSINVASGGFVVQSGMDAIIVGIIGPDEPEARTQATAFVQALLPSLTH